jgi:hypothetical protein
LHFWISFVALQGEDQLNMSRPFAFAATVVAIVTCSPAVVLGQAPAEARLAVQLEHFAWYWEDGDPNNYGTVTESLSPNPAGFAKGLKRNVIMADVVSINGKPARGAYVSDGLFLPIGASDLPRNHSHEFVLDLQTAEGQQIGSLFGTFLSSGTAAPGAPRGGGTWAVVGGSGAFVGVRGQGANMGGSSYHITSMRESTIARRTNARGKLLLDLYLSGVDVPEILAAHHANDFSAVTAANPAHPGEMLIVKVKANWPTDPPRTPGTVFGADPMHVVPDFLQAAVNGFPAEIVNRVGWPGERGVYRVDLLLPSMAPGNAVVNLTAGYVLGSDFKLPVR